MFELLYNTSIPKFVTHQYTCHQKNAQTKPKIDANKNAKTIASKYFQDLILWTLVEINTTSKNPKSAQSREKL